MPVAHMGVAGSVLRQPRRAPFVMFVDVAMLRALNHTNLHAALPRSMSILTHIPSTTLVIIFLMPRIMTAW
jgi:hypothetical protein